MLMRIKYDDDDAYIEYIIRISFLCILSLPRIIFFFHLVFTLEMRNFVKPLKNTEICPPPSQKRATLFHFISTEVFFSSVPVACILYNAHRLHYEEVVRVEFSV